MNYLRAKLILKHRKGKQYTEYTVPFFLITFAKITLMTGSLVPVRFQVISLLL